MLLTLSLSWFFFPLSFFQTIGLSDTCLTLGISGQSAVLGLSDHFALVSLENNKADASVELLHAAPTEMKPVDVLHLGADEFFVCYNSKTCCCCYFYLFILFLIIFY